MINCSFGPSAPEPEAKLGKRRPKLRPNPNPKIIKETRKRQLRV